MYLYTEQEILSLIIQPKIFKPTKLMIRMVVRSSGEKVYYLHKTYTKKSNYAGSGVKWKRFLKKHKPVLIWESEYYTNPIKLQYDAIKLSLEHNIVDSNLWANEKIENGLDGGWYSNSITKLNQRNEKTKKTFNDLEWKKTIGKQRANKIKTTINSEEWKNTTGKNSRIKISNKVSKTKNKKEWKNTKGVVRDKKHKETINSEEWKKEHWKICEVCKKGPMRPNLFSRYHSNCLL